MALSGYGNAVRSAATFRDGVAPCCEVMATAPGKCFLGASLFEN